MTRWTSRSIGSRLQHGIFYALIRTLGPFAAYTLLVFVAAWYTIRPLTRARSAPYLRRRFPEAGAAARLLHCFRLHWNFGLTLVDRATVGILGRQTIVASPEDEQTLNALLAEGRGLILLSAHVGCWQTAMAGLHVTGTPVHVVMHRAPDDVDRHYFEHAGERAPFTIIDPQGFLGGTVDMVRALAQGHLLCLMGDRTLGNDRNTVDVTFLNGRVQLPFSPYHLASRTGAPILVFFSRRVGPGRAEHRVADVLRVPGNLGRSAAAYRPHAQAFASALEELTRDTPYQFFNFYDMWESPNHEHRHPAETNPDPRTQS